MIGPALGTILFVTLVPGTAIGVVPYLLSGWVVRPALFSGARAVGVLLFPLALLVFVNFNLRFVREGRGTPAPIAPTQRLVVGGPFRYVRNPGYLSALSMILGQGLFFGNVAVLIYAAVLALGFHLFVLLYEEPTLRRQFGGEYEDYCRRVPRWIPRPPRRTLTVLLALASAACNQDPMKTYPPDVVGHFMESCQTRADRRSCTCAIVALQRRFTLEEFRALEVTARSGEVPKEMADIVADCR
jgi:protein-S-isoprenylcysteine O-methyltransferase Ste14